MALHNPLLDLACDGLFSTLLPDFVLSYTLFTALNRPYHHPAVTTRHAPSCRSTRRYSVSRSTGRRPASRIRRRI